MRTLAALALLAGVLLGAARAGAQELGRLFFTPDQRAALDARRKARVPDKPAAVLQVESPTTRVDGAVRRAGGRSTVWVNGEAIPEGAQPAGARLAPRDPGAARVTIPVGESAQSYDLRVGESVNRGSGEVRDVVGAGTVRVGPGPGAAKK